MLSQAQGPSRSHLSSTARQTLFGKPCISRHWRERRWDRISIDMQVPWPSALCLPSKCTMTGSCAISWLPRTAPTMSSIATRCARAPILARLRRRAPPRRADVGAGDRNSLHLAPEMPSRRDDATAVFPGHGWIAQSPRVAQRKGLRRKRPSHTIRSLVIRCDRILVRGGAMRSSNGVCRRRIAVTPL